MTTAGSALVVDDDEHIRALVSVILDRAGYRVRTFGCPSEAIVAAHQCPPDLYVLDVRLPHMNGRDLCRALKSDQRTRRPVLMISAEAADADITSARAAGCDDFLTKPFRRAELISKVQNLPR